MLDELFTKYGWLVATIGSGIIGAFLTQERQAGRIAVLDKRVSDLEEENKEFHKNMTTIITETAVIKTTLEAVKSTLDKIEKKL